MSAQAIDRWGGCIAEVLQGQAHELVAPGKDPLSDVDIAFVSRDVTGRPTKHEVLPDTQHFYDLLLQAPRLRWVQIHSAGVDRPVYLELLRRGVQVTTSAGANARVVAQTVLAGVLALARRLPQLQRAQAERRWAPLLGPDTPRDLEGQTALVVGWGPIGQQVTHLLQSLGLRVSVARMNDTPVGPDIPTASYRDIERLLPQADWVILACPLTEATHHLMDARALALLPPGAHLVNVSRGDVVDEPALIAALHSGRLAGAFLDVFAHEPLVPDSPLWAMPHVIATPHSAGFADSNAARVADVFLANLARWRQGLPLAGAVSGAP